MDATATPLLNTLFLVALILLALVSGGILYLTALEWRDRRRQDRDRKLRGLIMISRWGIVFVLALGLVFGLTFSWVNAQGTSEITVVAAGDIACSPEDPGFNGGRGRGDRCQMAATANLVGRAKPQAVLALGDNQYERGELDFFRRSYDLSWGKYKAITYPVPGNHEYYTPGAQGYYDYFGARAGKRDQGYYSFNLGNWHLIALNSNCDAIGGCGAGSPQERWLKRDLQTNKKTCTLAFWHHPRFSSGVHGNNPELAALWQDLYEAKAELVLSGHDHDYERFAPQGVRGQLEPSRGIRQFVVGAGGKSLYPFKTTRPNSEVRLDKTYGVLDLKLKPQGYRLRYLALPGEKFGIRARETVGKMSADEIYMARCLDLARQGLGKTAPNPLVGSVIVKNGQIVGEGYHPQAGQPHAEIFALRQAGALAQGATLYVNLEPCNHQGRTPPCTEAIIKAGIQRVVAGMIDPNPLVSGQGLRRLQQDGLEVTAGILESECRRLNRAFIQRVTQRRPWGIYKYAMTLDGKIAASSGHSAWVTGEPARQRVHQLRGQCEAVIVGGQTVRRDNPRLTSHGQGVKDPLRVVLSRGLDLPREANLWDQSQAPTLVVTETGADEAMRGHLDSLGVEVLVLPRLTPGEIMAELYRRDCLQVLWECGGALAAPVIADNCVQEIWAFIAPKLIGGAQAPSPLGDLGLELMSQALTLSEVEIEAIGADWLIRGLLPPWQRSPDGGQ